MSPTPIPDAPDAPDAGGSHYFEDPTIASDPVVVDVTLADTAFTMETDTGVFSRGHLDAGTSLLLRSSAVLASHGDLLDLGAGSGAIALTMARRSPDATVWALDVNSRARDLCRRNAVRNGLTNVRVVAPDDVPADARFSTIWSNPPIRIGKIALHALLLTWLARLDAAGTATLVVQKHLGADSLQRWLTGAGHPTQRLMSKAGFRLLAVGPDPGDRA